jgi:hypothetical protein
MFLESHPPLLISTTEIGDKTFSLKVLHEVVRSLMWFHSRFDSSSDGFFHMHGIGAVIYDFAGA